MCTNETVDVEVHEDDGDDSEENTEGSKSAPSGKIRNFFSKMFLNYNRTFCQETLNEYSCVNT